ncbi:hypothetical protein GCM10009539_28740 [Cryptosporangium japonicum]|uniref:Adhesin domain-containing protein n=1 Tax=Cryptosporangium japonicum TaxID=80872 RepID=A0ABN0U7X0_9ACTN
MGGSAFAVAVLLVGTLVAVGSTSHRSAESTLTYAGVRRLVVDNTGGSGTLRVRGGGTTVTVHRRASWSLSRPRLAERRTGDTLTLTGDCHGDRVINVRVNCAVDYDIDLPPRTRLVATTAGRVDVTGVTGPIDLTAPGPITVTGAHGPVSTRTRR